MATYIVTYDLNRETTRPPIVDAIKNVGTRWARLSESSYAITSNATPGQVFNELKPMLDSNDNLYVITLKKPYSGFGPQKVNEWLENNLTY